jgi:hypothetical protein
MRWPSKRPTLDDIAWIAGVIEGEGSFGWSTISVPQKDPEILDRIQALVGGRVGGPYPNRKPSGEPSEIYRWWATGERGRGIARTVFHYLSTRRREQAARFLGISRGQEPEKLTEKYVL